MRAFLELLGSGESLADLAKLAPRLAPGELDALRAEGFLQPTGSRGFEEVSLPDVIRALRALWGAGSGGVRSEQAVVAGAGSHIERLTGRTRSPFRPRRSSWNRRLVEEVRRGEGYLSAVGQIMPGRVKEVGIFSHSHPGGPILFDQPGDNSGTDARDPKDFDGRMKDFNTTNMASWPKMKDAMDANGKWQVWGCSATTHHNNLIAAAQQHRSDGDTFLFTVDTSFLTASTHAIQSVTKERTNRQQLRVKMDAQFRTNSYMAAAASVLGVSVFGAPPGVGSNFRSNLLFVDEKDNRQSFAYFRDQFGPEFTPTSDPVNTGYVDYKALAGRSAPTAPFLSDIFMFELNGDLFSSPSVPFTLLIFANGRGLRMAGTSITMTPTLKPAFMPGSTQRGWTYELRDTSDDTKSRAVYVQDDAQIFTVNRDAAGNFTVPGTLITSNPL